MSDDTPTFRVNFTRPMAIFPLGGVVVLPQQAIPLHIFEPRYRAMVSDALDGSGQIAMAVLDEDEQGEVPTDSFGRPRVRPCVCVTQMAKHETLPDGRYNIVVQGICRARIEEEMPPSVDRAYRTAMLSPMVDDSEPDDEVEALRVWVRRELELGALRHLSAAGSVLEYVRDEQVPTPAVLELLGFALTAEPDMRYRLLAEPTIAGRGRILQRELASLGRSIELSEPQRSMVLPKGCRWN